MGLVPSLDLRGNRVLIFIVAYNAETTIEKVLSRIPASLHQRRVEVLIIDDSSRDETFLNGLRYQQRIPPSRSPSCARRKTKVTAGTKNSAIATRSITVSTSSRSSMATASTRRKNCLLCSRRCSRGEADAVFGSRMIDKRAARAGGMPLYKWIGNQILTSFPEPDAWDPSSPSSTPAIASIRPTRWRKFRSRKTRTISISTPKSSSSSCSKSCASRNCRSRHFTATKSAT